MLLIVYGFDLPVQEDNSRRLAQSGFTNASPAIEYNPIGAQWVPCQLLEIHVKKMSSLISPGFKSKPAWMGAFIAAGCHGNESLDHTAVSELDPANGLDSRITQIRGSRAAQAGKHDQNMRHFSHVLTVTIRGTLTF